MGCQNWLQCAVEEGGEETRLPRKKRLVASLIDPLALPTWFVFFSCHVSIDLDLVHSFFPFFFSLIFPFIYLFFRTRQQGSVHFGVVFSWIIFYGVVEGGKDIVNAVPVL